LRWRCKYSQLRNGPEKVAIRDRSPALRQFKGGGV
jgi:hypothetical protein